MMICWYGFLLVKLFDFSRFDVNEICDEAVRIVIQDAHSKIIIAVMRRLKGTNRNQAVRFESYSVSGVHLAKSQISGFPKNSSAFL